MISHPVIGAAVQPPAADANLLIADHWMALWISPACFRG
jgi:hypothetical protein